MRSRRSLPVLVVAVTLALSACSLVASRQGLGSHDADFTAIQAAMDTTISEAGLHVRSRTPGGADLPCLGTGTKHAASDSVVVDLSGEDPVAISRRVEAVWQRHADEWFGGGLTVEETIPGSARVSASKGAWTIEAEVPDNKNLGPYVIDASAPCYW
jgi:hypothetical protein